jgi:hypothetical protein
LAFFRETIFLYFFSDCSIVSNRDLFSSNNFYKQLHQKLSGLRQAQSGRTKIQDFGEEKRERGEEGEGALGGRNHVKRNG